MDDDFDMAGAVDTIGAGLDLGGGDVDPGLAAKPGTGEEDASLDFLDPAAPGEEGKPAEATPPAEGEVDTAVPAEGGFTPSEEHKHLFNEKGQLRTWRPEAAAAFAKADPILQAEVLKREEDIFKGIEGYKEAAAYGDGFKKVLEPYMPALRQYNLQPEAQVAKLMNAQFTLAFGTQEEKGNLIALLARDYNIDLVDLASSQPFVDPQVRSLQSQLQGVQSQLTNAQQAQQAQRKAELEQEIQAFSTDPSNIYFEEVWGEMAGLLSSKQATDLKDAYSKAIWLNPIVRAKELSRQQTEKDLEAKKQAADKVEAAKRATAANISSSTKGGSAATPLGSMDDTLAVTLASIRSRG